jgi:DNA-binding NarL/FixJ family response regulator
MAADRIRVLLIDDHAVLRAGLANLLSLERDLMVVGEADNGEEGVRLWQTCQPDVAIIDVNMTGMDGVETTKRIRRLAPDAKILMLTSSESAADAARSVGAGAAAYLTKRVAHEEIVAVIRKVHAGQKSIQSHRLGRHRRRPHPGALPAGDRARSVRHGPRVGRGETSRS